MADFSIENELSAPVCGIDEVGRGPLAGPVVAACVHIPDNVRPLPFITEIKDSKKLSWAKLEKLYHLIIEHCFYGVAEISPQEIDRINILQASLKAMENAYSAMGLAASYALIDGNKIPKNIPCPARAIVKGDSKSKSIAAASILAKVTRDRIMHDLHKAHPYYGWASNVGYPTKVHIKGLDEYGITIHHRKSFAPVRERLALQK